MSTLRFSRTPVVMLSLLAVLVSGTVWWICQNHDRSDADADRGSVRIVSAAARTSAFATLSPPIAVASPGSGQAVDLAQMTVNERSEYLERRPRDAVWSTRTEAALLAQLRDAAGEIVPDAARCADTVCSVQGTIPVRPPSERERLVDQLVRGRLHVAYDRAGLKPMQAISIEADDVGNLHFTEYLLRK